MTVQLDPASPDNRQLQVAEFLARLAAAPPQPLLDGTTPIDRSALAPLALERARMGAWWLARVIQPDGSFPYVYYPRTDAYDSARYNEVRHAGTTFSLFQACDIALDSSVPDAAEAAAAYIAATSILTPFGGQAFAYHGRAKLGGQALALVALLERRRTTNDHGYDPLISDLAAFLHAMELPAEPGRYHQSYEAANQQLLLTPDSDYYPGEALLALTRLAQHFPDGPHLAAAQRAAAYLIRHRDGDIIAAGIVPRQDHWLTIALGALFELDPNPDYAAVAFLQAESMIDTQHQPDDPEPWRIGAAFRSPTVNFTSTATRAEALLAAWQLAAYLDNATATERFSNAALRTIQFLMRVQYTEALSKHFPRPGRVTGGWAQDAANPRIRLDFVQHNISALIGAHTLLTRGQPPTQPAPAAQAQTAGPSITILETKQFDGPNVWSQMPVTLMVLDATGVASARTEDLPNIARQLRILLSKLDAMFPIPSGGDPSTLHFWDETSLATIFTTLTVELQQRAGAAVDFHWSKPIDGTLVSRVAFQHRHGAVAMAVAKLALRILNAVVAGTPKIHLRNEFTSGPARLMAAEEYGVSTAAIVSAAEGRGIPISRTDAQRNMLAFGNGAYMQRVLRMASSLTSTIGVKIAGNKLLTNQVLRKAGLPAPVGETVRNVDQALLAAGRIGYPVTLKPPNLNHATGVYLDLQNDDDVRKYFPPAAAAVRSGEVMVEQFISGAEYRILVIADRVAGVYQRFPPEVVGDGEHSVHQLIDLVNADPLRGREETGALHQIHVDARTLEMLERQHIGLDEAPGAGQVVQLKPTGYITTGGDSVDLTDKIHPDNIAIARQAARVIGLDIAGLDVVAYDITQSIWETSGAIVEVNSGPDFTYHLYPVQGTPRDVGGAVVEMLFPPGQPFRAPIIAVTGCGNATPVCQLIAHILTTGGQSVGLATRDGVVIDGMSMLSVESCGPAGVRTLLNNPGVETAVVEVEPQAIIDLGLGFDYCDVAVITSLSGLITPFQQPVETVLTTLVDSRGTLVLNADDPATSMIADQEAGATLLFSLDETNQRVLSHIDQGGSAVVLRKTPAGDAIALINAGTDHVLLQIAAVPSIADNTLTIQQAIAAAAAAASQTIPPATIQTAMQTFQSARR